MENYTPQKHLPWPNNGPSKACFYQPAKFKPKKNKNYTTLHIDYTSRKIGYFKWANTKDIKLQ